MKEKIRKFIKDENITFKKIINPIFTFKLLYKHRVIQYFLIGVSGLIINLILTYLLTEFYFGVDHYFYGFLIALFITYIYNFTLHSFNFFSKENHLRKLLYFFSYSIVIETIKSIFIKNTTDIIGNEYYLFVIAFYLLIFAVMNFLIFKLIIFKNRNNHHNIKEE